MDENNPVYDLYIETSATEGPIPLEEFLQRLLSNEFGSFSKDSVLEFIDIMEQNVMSSIQIHSVGLSEPEIEKIIEFEKGRFEKLRRRVEG